MNTPYTRTFENLMFVESNDYIAVDGYRTLGHAQHLTENNCRAILKEYDGYYRWHEFKSSQWLASARDSMNTLLRYLEMPINTIVLQKL
jgi:hypothetical protein